MSEATPVRAGRNVLGEALQSCSTDPMTGFYRDGCCRTGPEDVGLHTVCAVMTTEFLEFSKSRGNDLSTPRPEWGFPGLKAGDRWCLCAARWRQADEAGMALAVAQSDFWETKGGQNALRKGSQRNFPDFISRVPAKMLAEVGLRAKEADGSAPLWGTCLGCLGRLTRRSEAATPICGS